MRVLTDEMMQCEITKKRSSSCLELAMSNVISQRTRRLAHVTKWAEGTRRRNGTQRYECRLRGKSEREQRLRETSSTRKTDTSVIKHAPGNAGITGMGINII